MAFAFSAAFAGLAGGLRACYLGVLDPSTFGFMKSIEILVMVVLGGATPCWAPSCPRPNCTILPEATRFDGYRMRGGSTRWCWSLMIFRPGGLLGSATSPQSRIVERS